MLTAADGNAVSYPTRIANLLAVLALPNYRIYTSGNVVSLIGTWVQRIAVGWLTWEITRSGVWLGLMAFADLFPVAFIGPFAGAIADRTDRLRLTWGTQAAACLIAIVLFILAATAWINVYSLFALTLASGIVTAVNQPARLAMISSMVPRNYVPAAVAMNSVVFNVARFIGPAVAGIAIAVSGVALAFALNAASFIAFLIALSRIELRASEPRPVQSEGLMVDLREGFLHVARHHGLASVFILTISTCVCGRPVVELLPGLADAVFNAGATGLAVLTSSIGAGSIIAGLWLGGGTPHVLPRTIVSAAALLSLAILLFAATNLMWIATPAMMICGFAMASAGIGSQTMIHLSVAPHMRGRVLSMHGIVFRAGPALGALIMGGASDVVGLRLPLAIGAMVVLVVAVWMQLRIDAVTQALTSEWNRPR
jgi:predicted MFS family arabinose efflux permease